ncbi:hypothetical protein ACHBTE_31565 [Streptomyces sp. M41]|uniref:hypothetical protein n=1 Tax=Streptomyces sp. M41 TaxID=3059412 RepID=UPI00374CE935
MPVAPAACEPPPEPPRAGRRGRTAALIACAAVLGLVAGTCTGYLIQADRKPDKLPSLSQPKLPQAKGAAPEPLPAAQDRRVRTEGDLRKLLLKKPRGAKSGVWLRGADGWMDLADYARTYEQPQGIFGELISDEFRRAAVVGWKKGDVAVEIRLIQFRQEESAGAVQITDDNQYWAETQDADSWVVPGTENGMAYAYSEPESKAGYLPLYAAEAFAWRGDIAMQIFAFGSKPVTKKTILGLAERQMERL